MVSPVPSFAQLHPSPNVRIGGSAAGRDTPIELFELHVRLRTQPLALRRGETAAVGDLKQEARPVLGLARTLGLGAHTCTREPGLVRDRRRWRTAGDRCSG